MSQTTSPDPQDPVILHPTHPERVLFRHHEIACKATGVVKLASGFAGHLAFLRISFGEGMIPSSCCRSVAHNEAEDGHPRSLHVYDEPYHPVDGAAAIDIKTLSANYAWRLANVAFKQGWAVGVNRSFIHLDRRDLAGLNPKALFGY